MTCPRWWCHRYVSPRASYTASGGRSEALRSGVHRTYVGGVERGEYNVTVLTLKKFTKVLGLSLPQALGGA